MIVISKTIFYKLQLNYHNRLVVIFLCLFLFVFPPRTDTKQMSTNVCFERCNSSGTSRAQ